MHVFVEVDTTLGRLRFGEGKLAWNGVEIACAKLDRSWGGGVRSDGSAYFRGTLSFRCGNVIGDLALDCGQITALEAGQLAANRAAAMQRAAASPEATASPAAAPRADGSASRSDEPPRPPAAGSGATEPSP